MSFIPNPSIGAPGSPVPGESTQVAGSDGTDLRTLATDASGRQKVLLYDASGNAITSTSSALDDNLKLIGGTAVDTNSGNKSAGTQRVILATDQPQLTNPLKVEEYNLGSGDVWIPKKVANLQVTAQNVASATVIIAGSAGLYIYITAIIITIWPSATGTGGLNFVTVIAQTSGTALFQYIFAVPASAPTTGPVFYPQQNTPPSYYTFNAAVGDGIEVIHNLTSAKFTLQVNYGFTASP
jgi:hypothetical protein